MGTIELALAIENRTKIYLDLRFWIIARDAALGVRTDSASRKLLHHLSRGVRKGALLCPISSSVFCELFKQPYKANRRIATTKLIDELSLGVTMARADEIRNTEVHRFLLDLQGRKDLYPMQQLIWTKVSYALGDVYAMPDGVSQEVSDWMQREFFDHLWEMPLSKIVETLSDSEPPEGDHAALSAETNAQCRRYADELTSFAVAYDTELRGVIEELGSIGASSILEQARAAGCSGEPNSAELASYENSARQILYHGFKHAGGTDKLRSLHIGASIHAAMRWDKGRNFKTNDWHDFEHATAALAYCDAFLTEGSLHHLVTRPQVDLEKVNGCRVISDLEEAVEFVASAVAAKRAA
jgi:hypothetical protein